MNNFVKTLTLTRRFIPPVSNRARNEQHDAETQVTFNDRFVCCIVAIIFTSVRTVSMTVRMSNPRGGLLQRCSRPAIVAR